MNLSHRPRHSLLFATLVLALPLALAGCGNKGPLVMPERPAENETRPTPEGSVPVEIATPQTLPDDATAAPAAVDPDTPTLDPRVPIDPATVPDASEDGTDADGTGIDSDAETPPATGTTDDGNG